VAGRPSARPARDEEEEKLEENATSRYEITVYSKPRCPQCDATKRLLNKMSAPYAKADVTEDDVAHSFVKSMGYQQVPVVVVRDRHADTGEDGRGDNIVEHWSGFRPDRIKRAAAAALDNNK
jgi:glutaredoxin-like protein NrdH